MSAKRFNDTVDLSGLPREMKCEDLAETLADVGFWDTEIDEAFWERNFDTDRFFESMKAVATEEGITLSDSDEFDYDRYFYNMYQCTEKGLS